MTKILPLINPRGAPITTICMKCNTEIKSGEGYAAVTKSIVKGFVCEDCYINSLDTFAPEMTYIFELSLKG